MASSAHTMQLQLSLQGLLQPCLHHCSPKLLQICCMAAAKPSQSYGNSHDQGAQASGSCIGMLTLNAFATAYFHACRALPTLAVTLKLVGWASSKARIALKALSTRSAAASMSASACCRPSAEASCPRAQRWAGFSPAQPSASHSRSLCASSFQASCACRSLAAALHSHASQDHQHVRSLLLRAVGGPPSGRSAAWQAARHCS